ncbi:MAG: hypothetical protein IPH69_06320 [Bacteroidales bacterium]|nr:hypothetical protein [Bacteroidales bacterium]MBK7627472.1 hypothetical protein [Bacteroidales bacterium]
MRYILFLLSLFVFNFSNGQETKLSFTDSRFANEWWYPLIEKHNIDAAQFTFWSNLKPAADDPKGYTALELGTGASIKDTVITINDPVFIIKDNDDGYSFITAKTATHNLKISRIDWKNGRMKYYKIKSDEAEPVQNMTFDDLSYETRTKRMMAKKVKGVEPI